MLVLPKEPTWWGIKIKFFHFPPLSSKKWTLIMTRFINFSWIFIMIHSTVTFINNNSQKKKKNKKKYITKFISCCYITHGSIVNISYFRIETNKRAKRSEVYPPRDLFVCKTVSLISSITGHKCILRKQWTPHEETIWFKKSLRNVICNRHVSSRIMQC